jgi:hypothetical protein
MEWIITSRGEITRGISESPHYTSEDDFLAALRDLFRTLRSSSSAPPCLMEEYSMRLPRRGLLSQ